MADYYLLTVISVFSMFGYAFLALIDSKLIFNYYLAAGIIILMLFVDTVMLIVLNKVLKND